MESDATMRKFLLVTTACVLAPFAIASAQEVEVSGEVSANADEDTMAADLNAQQLAAFRAGDAYEGEGDIETDVGVGATTDDVGGATLDSETDVDVDEDGVTGEGDIDADVDSDIPDAIEEGADDAEDSARDTADDIRDEADEAADDLSPDAEEAVEDAADETADEIEESADAVEDMADDVEDSIEEPTEEITEDPLINDEDDVDVSTPPYDQPDEADAIKDPSDPN
jgi:hypothetical protein